MYSGALWDTARRLGAPLSARQAAPLRPSGPKALRGEVKGAQGSIASPLWGEVKGGALLRRRRSPGGAGGPPSDRELSLPPFRRRTKVRRSAKPRAPLRLSREASQRGRLPASPVEHRLRRCPRSRLIGKPGSPSRGHPSGECRAEACTARHSGPGVRLCKAACRAQAFV